MPFPTLVALVLCPMSTERAPVERSLRRAGVSGSHARVVQTGVGKDAIVARLRAEVAWPGPRPGLVILAGVCGALAEVVDVPPIARVIDEHGQTWTGGVGFADPDAGGGRKGVTLIAVDRVVATPADKRSLARDTGAAIVDMESHAFAAACAQLGLRWTIVRGVSDTPDETLPHEVLGWLTPAGDTRPARAAWDLARKPSLIPHVLAVLRRSKRVMPKVGERVVELVRAEAGS